MPRSLLDCLVIGGGPAGLTAAIYLSRFHLRVLVVDRGNSRALSIATSHNHAGFPKGIAGADLVARMAEQARAFGTIIREGDVTGLSHSEGDFIATMGEETLRAKTVLLATGVTNHRPDMPAGLHELAVAKNLLRYCPVCDGYEVTDRRVGVIGSGSHGAREAMFLRSFTRDVTLISLGTSAFSGEDRTALDEAGIVLADGPISDYSISDDEISITTPTTVLRFAAIYPALGSTIHSDLAVGVGADVADTGCIKVDAHQRTSIPGLYAAGDVVLGLDQISHAMGEAGVAATAIRNDLDARAPLRR